MELSRMAAQVIVDSEVPVVDLPHLKSLKPEVANILSKCGKDWNGYYVPENYLYLDGLLEIPVESLKALSRWYGAHLRLNGLTSLSPEAAKAIAAWDAVGTDSYGDPIEVTLELSGVRTLSIEAATELAKWPSCRKPHEGYRNLRLILKGLSELSPEAAEKLACSNARDIHFSKFTNSGRCRKRQGVHKSGNVYEC